MNLQGEADGEVRPVILAPDLNRRGVELPRHRPSATSTRMSEEESVDLDNKGCSQVVRR